MTLDFFKDLYKIELERRQQLNAALSLPSGILTLLGGLLASMATNFQWGRTSAQILFLILLLLAAVALGLSALLLARFFWGHSVQYIAKATDLRQWHKDLVSHYKENEEAEEIVSELAARDFQEGLIDRLAVAASFNAMENNRRSLFLFWANGLLLLGLLLTGLAAIPYAISSR